MSNYTPATSPSSTQGEHDIQKGEDFVKAHRTLKEIIPVKHHGSLTSKFTALGGVTPIQHFMRTGERGLETIKNMFPRYNVGG